MTGLTDEANAGEPSPAFFSLTILSREFAVLRSPRTSRPHKLDAPGHGKARRYPRATAEALHGLRTRGLYLDALKSFCNWLGQDRRTAG